MAVIQAKCPALALWLCFTPLGWVLAAQGFDQGAPPEHVRLQLKWYHQFQFAGYYAAQVKGFYEEHGLQVTILPGDPKHLPIRQVLQSQAEYGVSDADVLKAYLDGKPLVVLAAIFQHSPYVLLTRADHGLRSPSDLQGRTVMLSDEHGIAQLQAVLQREGMSLDAVKVIPHTWDNQMLADGRVDAMSAYSTVEPFQLRALGVEPFLIRARDYGIDFYGDTLFTTREEVEEHQDRVARFRTASLRGWEYAMSNPVEMVDLILELPGVRDRGITREMLLFEAEAMRELILPDLVEIGHMNPGRWETMARTYYEIGAITELPSSEALEDFFYDPKEQVSGRNWVLPLLLALLALLFVALWAVAWNVQLRRAVARRTIQLSRAEQRLRYHVENSPLAVVEWDSGFRVMRWAGEAQRVFGWRAEEVRGKHPLEWKFVYDEDRHATSNVMSRLMETKEKGVISLNRNYRKDGSVVECEWYNTALRDEQGRVISVLSLVLDVTTRNQALRELARSKDALEQIVRERTAKLRQTLEELEHFSYAIVHDMRAPLRAMQGYATVVEDEFSQQLPAQGRDFLRRIKVSARRMDALVTDALSYSRALQEDLPLARVDLNELLHGLVQSYPNLQDPSIELNIAAGLPAVLGSPAALTQCFSNLLGNAVKFVPPERTPRVRVWAEETGASPPPEPGAVDTDRSVSARMVRVWVEDNGLGISPEHQSRIFEMFQRLHTSREFDGNGIGLAIVRKVVERMGGRVGVESRLGEGSRFWVELLPADTMGPLAGVESAKAVHRV